MPRKFIDIFPVIRVSPATGCCTDPAHAQLMAEGMVRAIEGAFSRRQVSTEVTIETDARCEFCNDAWTEPSPDWNGGCCDRDEANDPDRLARLRAMATEVEGGDFHTLNEGRPSRIPVHWPDTLAGAALAWLDGGRTAEGALHLIPVANRVNREDWCTIWSDPGPSGCSLARLPDHISHDSRPEELAEELLRLIDDMGLTPVRQGAAA